MQEIVISALYQISALIRSFTVKEKHVSSAVSKNLSKRNRHPVTFVQGLTYRANGRHAEYGTKNRYTAQEIDCYWEKSTKKYLKR